jgi:meiotic recombination protein REC8
MNHDLPNVENSISINALLRTSSLSTARTIDSSFIISHESEEVVAIPLRRGPKPRKPILMDQSIEFRKSDSMQHDSGYLQHMIAATREHLNRKLHHQARKNAEYFITGKGLNGIGKSLHPNTTNPLAMFSGEGLYEWVFGNQYQGPKIGTKRASSNDDTSNSRRVRSRTAEYDPTSFDDEDAILRMDEDVEVARRGDSELEDISSAVMPWTISASKRGSSISRLGVGSTTRRARLVSASPLQSRGATLAPLDEIDFQLSEIETIPDTDPNDPEAIILARSQQIGAAIDKDGNDFMIFLKNEIAIKQAEQEQLASQLNAEPHTVNLITFEELMAPNIHHRIIAARGFLVVCTLASKNLIRVVQDDHFGEIVMSLV